MSAVRWNEVKALFHEALARPERERAAFLAAATSGDTELRVEVESLLSADADTSGAAPDDARSAALASLLLGSESPAVGRRVGAYRLEREIGRGGMGTVYLAARADDQYRQRVAVKLLRLGLDSDDMLRRFRQERQILANLDHPNIARLLDGGLSEDGRPFLVMEYVEGRPIGAYCDEQRLGLAARLRLFRSVCAAVQHAHGQLVIHRDLKPANILVTPDGVLKLLDFGIAKALDPAETAEPLTRTGVRPLTPLYASPEQLRGEALGTASDVYSLGVILYELLCGRRPFEGQAGRHTEFERLVCEQEPPRPSEALDAAAPEVGHTRSTNLARLRRELRGDLDTIVLMALRKDPRRRYASAAQLAEDVQRHIDGRPVLARSDTLAYRASKFLARHRVTAAVSSLALAAVLVAAATAWRQARLAERRFAEVRELSNAFLFEFHDAIANLPGSTAARELVVRKALEYLGRLSRDAHGDVGLQRDLAAAYVKVGRLQGGWGTAGLGDTQGAAASYRSAMALLDDALHARPNDAGASLERATAQAKLGDVLGRTGDRQAALAAFSEAIPVLERAAEDGAGARGGWEHDAALAEALGDRADVRASAGDRPKALEDCLRAERILSRRAAGAAAPREVRRRLALVSSRLGELRQASGDARAALAIFEKSLAMRERLAAEDPADSAARRELFIIHKQLGDVAGHPDMPNLGDRSRALREYAQALAIADALAAEDRRNVVAQRDAAVVRIRIGSVLLVDGPLKEALARFHEALRTFEALSETDPANVQLRRDLSITHERIASLQLRLQDATSSLESYRRCASVREALCAKDPGNRRSRSELAECEAGASDALVALSRLPEARAALKSSVAMVEALMAANPADDTYRVALAVYSERLGDTYRPRRGAPPGAKRAERDAWRQACAFYGRALEHARAADPAFFGIDTRDGTPEDIHGALAALQAQVARCARAFHP